ncbi:hypothetical protein C5167_044796 [Papaver somniferum]|nr:hypothetical protein C5167_044796 [Papaver somniferum]
MMNHVGAPNGFASRGPCSQDWLKKPKSFSQIPNYFAYFPFIGSIAGFLGEMLSTRFNVVGFNWMSSPAATELQIIVMNWLGFGFGTDVSYDGRAMIINGDRQIILSGSIHYPRSTPEMWPDLIKKSKEGGLDAIETYVFWNAHEPLRRQHPHRTAEDVAFSVARFFQRGGTFQNYYMYHGGTNFGRSAGGPYISTTYDYDAPLDEFGNLNQPKWGHLKELHQVLKSMQKTLTYGDITDTDFNNSVSVTKYSFNGTSSCFFSNANETSDAEVTFEGTKLVVPAWSVSVLSDCRNDDYNTAKINTQTSVMVKKADNEVEDAQSGLNWVWRPENTKDTTVLGKGTFSANRLLEQKTASNDVSDYLWYMTSVDMNEQDLMSDKDEILLRVNTSGHVLHAFVNGEHVGSQWAAYGTYKFMFEQKIRLNHGKNQISLLSATVGLQNYGPKFDSVDTGLAGVQLIAKNNDELIIKDLSAKEWIYKVGLHGEDANLHSVESPSASKWLTKEIPSNKLLTWYKTTFKAPSGTDAVVVDLKGMGKGHAWVNGKSIGRFWPSFLAANDGCEEICDYRGSYSDKKCASKCGEPSQRWYHVPRSFLRADSNTLILFEEVGGNPSKVNFQTIKVGSVCANAYEGRSLEISCHGRTISAISFASFGNPQGSCGSFERGPCDSESLISIVEKACVGKETCSIDVSLKTLGSSACGGINNKLAVEATCR